jgi:ABC-2 type transport system permease protein
VRTLLRQQWVCYCLQLKMLSTSAFEGFLAVLFPLMFASATLLLYQLNGDPESLQYAALGVTIMGMWTCQGVVAATLMGRERWAGTLELVIAAPTAFGRIVVPITMAMSTIGFYCVIATILWMRFVFGITLDVASWPLFVLSVLVGGITLALIGYFIAVTAVRYRSSGALGAALEYPGWLLCGFVVPLAVLPAWTNPISWSIPTTWAMAAVRSSASGASPWRELLLCGLTGVVYAVLAAWLGRVLIDSARRHASLALK